MIKVIVNKKGVASSGTNWMILQKELSGFLLRGVARVSETVANAAEEGDEIEIPKAIDEAIKWD